jgi:ribose transport system substrate-binding protein
MATQCILAVAMVGLASLTSCSRSHSKMIGVVSKGQAHEFWRSVHAGAVAAGRRSGVDIAWNGPAQETDLTRQIQIVESMITRHVDGIALAPIDKSALVPYVTRAEKEGIPVTIYDSGLDSQDYLSFVATNNYQAGQMAARKLGELLGGKGKVIEVKHMPGSASSMDRESGFADTIQRELPDVHIVGEDFGMGDRDKVLAITENLLTAHPDANAIFASAESSSVGAARAVEERKLSGKIKFVGFDSSHELIEALNKGVISALLVQDPFRIGFEAVETVVEALNGRHPPRRMDLSAVVITKADLDKPSIQKLLNPDVDKYLN